MNRDLFRTTDNEKKKLVILSFYIILWFLLPNTFESNLFRLFIKFNLVCGGDQSQWSEIVLKQTLLLGGMWVQKQSSGKKGPTMDYFFSKVARHVF